MLCSSKGGIFRLSRVPDYSTTILKFKQELNRWEEDVEESVQMGKVTLDKGQRIRLSP